MVVFILDAIQGWCDPILKSIACRREKGDRVFYCILENHGAYNYFLREIANQIYRYMTGLGLTLS